MRSPRYGHSPADECLVRIASVLDHAFGRGGDYAARYGACQFALMFEGAAGIAQSKRVLHAIAALEIPHVRSPSSLFVSASLGVVSVAASTEHTPQTSMGLAESLLQAASAAGGNRGEFHDTANGERGSVLLDEAP